MAYIQEIKDWNKGQKIKCQGYPYNWYIYFDPEAFEWYKHCGDEDEENLAVEDIDWMDDTWQPVMFCQHCNGTGIAQGQTTAPDKPKRTKKKAKDEDNSI